MKITRFFATDMRQAIRQVREALGPDAVILSNKTVDGGVELVAALDFDAADLATSAEVSAPAGRPAREAEVRSLAEHRQAQPEAPATPRPDAGKRSKRPRQARKSEPIEWSQEPVLVEMRREMRAMRRMMENELSELTWRELGRSRPQTQDLLRRLMAMGLAPDLCRDLAHAAGNPERPEQALRAALGNLAHAIPVAQVDFLDQGRAVALVGPTGVGKTTSVAKLAARFCLRHGNRHLALITTDNFRIGAEEQLHTYGRILDVPVRAVADADSLNAALNRFAEKRLVLIDTAGMSQRDLRLGEQLRLFTKGNRPVHTLLTLSATTQSAALEQAVDAFAAARPSGCVVTKTDEAGSLGGIVSLLVRRALPLAFTTDGQKVPEDIHIGRANMLVSRALELMQHSHTDTGDELLALMFGMGGAREHAHV